MFAELHLLHALRSHATYLADYNRPSPSLSFTPATGPVPFFTDAEIKLLEGARDAEGKASPDQEDAEDDAEDRQAEGARVEARGGTLNGAAACAEGARVEAREIGRAHV